MFTILIGALLPSVMLVYMIYRVDRFVEPASSMVIAFITGMCSPFVTLFFSYMFDLNLDRALHPWMYALSMAALPEELGRLLLLLWVCKSWRAVGEPFDCLVYGATIWAGFASTENILYALNEVKTGENPVVILAIRASLCTMGHTAWGIIMGAYVALYRYSEERSARWLFRGLLITVVLHLLYDGLLLSVHLGWPLLKITGAIVVDTFSLVLAAVILIRLRAIQGISQGEGDLRLLQCELFKRHLPDSTVGLLEIVSQFGLSGLFKMIFAMGCSALGLALILQCITEPGVDILWGGGLIYLGLKIWRSVLQLAYRVHLNTGAQLSDELIAVKQHRRLRLHFGPLKKD